MIALVVITLIGVVVNAKPEADKLFIVGSQRWVFLLLSSSFALTLSPPTLKGYRFLLIFASVIAVYAVFQSFTGIDLLRPGSHRAVQGLDVSKENFLWRSAGLFGSPMGYVYIAGMQACLILAVVMVFPKEAKKLRLFSLVAFILVAASLVTTYVRGAWFAMAIAYIIMAWMASRKVFYWVLGAGSTAFVVLFFGLVQFRERFMSLFNAGYTSNSERWVLWKMNWRMFKDYPIFGIGWEENETRACEYLNCNTNPKPFTGHAHNNYLQALSGLGITGFTAFVFFVGFFLWLTLRLYRRLPKDMYWARALTLGSFGAQIFLHLGGLTECNFKAGATNHNFMIVLGIVVSLSVLEAKGLLRKALPADNAAAWPRS